MFTVNRFNKAQRGQNALETAIILIAFIVVASVFAFAILSAGSASTEKGQEAIYAGLEGVQSSMQVRGAVTATKTGANVENVVFTVSLVSGGEPVDLTTGAAATKQVIIGYRDAAVQDPNVDWDVAWLVHKDGAAADALLEDGELAQITVKVSAETVPAAITLGVSTEFTLEVKPP